MATMRLPDATERFAKGQERRKQIKRADHAAWKAKAQGTVDNAEMRYFIVHLHRLLDPESQPPQR